MDFGEPSTRITGNLSPLMHAIGLNFTFGLGYLITLEYRWASETGAIRLLSFDRVNEASPSR